MEIITPVVPEESQKDQTNSIDTSYIPPKIDYSQVSINQADDANRWLESQLNSPKEFADRVKNLVDITWEDDYA